jgi:hypothetical protein
MLGWRKRKDGFEWREYVRTTILVRRKQRRDRIGEAGKAAVEHLKAAGQRGVEVGAQGAKAAGLGAARAGHQGAVMGAAGARAMARGAFRYGQHGAKLGVVGAQVAGSKLRAGLPVAADYLRRFGAALFAALAYSWAVLRTLAGIAADYLGPLLAPVGRLLRQSSLRLPLLIVGGVALLGGIIRAFANGFESDTLIALGIGVGVLGALALAHGASGIPSWLSRPAGSVREMLRGGLSGFTGRPVVQAGFAVLVLGMLVAGGVMAWRSSSDGDVTTASLKRQERRAQTPSPAASGTVEGRGSAITGDMLRVGSTVVRLDGIEAPEPDQTCTGPAGEEWSCGRTARQA